MDEPSIEQSREHELENLRSHAAKLANEFKTLQKINIDLHKKYEALEHTNTTILQKQLIGETKIYRLEEQFKLLQASTSNGERKATYQEVVQKNKKWKYPLDIPTVPELLTDGYDEVECEIIIDTITGIADMTKLMRMGEFIDVIYLANPTHPDEGYVINYNGYLPQYKEFAEALGEYRYTIDYMEDKSFTLSLDLESVPDDAVFELQNALQHTHFHKLQINADDDKPRRRRNHIDFIVKCVVADTKLESLSLRSVFFDSWEEMMGLFCRGVNDCKSLKQLNLDSCDLGEIFNNLKSKTLEKIDFYLCYLTDLRPTDMTELFSSNPCLRKLDLTGNRLNEQDIVYIADALRHNTTLRRLYLGIFDEPPSNLHLLEDIIFDHTSLNSAHDSNHHCQLDLSSYKRFNPEIIKFNTCIDPTMNRRKKIYTILSSRNRSRANAAYFEQDRIGIKHVPQILSLLKPYSKHHLKDENGIQGKDEVKPLSIVYEIMRGYKMPELYNLDLMVED